MKNLSKRVWASMLALVLVLGLMPATVNATEVEGIENVTYISSVEELIAFRDAVNSKTAGAESANVKLMSDIEIPAGTNWTPIGTWSSGAAFGENDVIFTGTFDGNGHTVKNKHERTPFGVRLFFVLIFTEFDRFRLWRSNGVI